MIKIIATAAIYLLTMLLAYVLKKMGLFHKEDKRALSNLIFYVTLPASLISGFSGAQVNIYYVVSILIGFGVNTVMVIAGQLAAAHKERDMQAIYAVNASGFNMACIAIPFLSNFYPAVSLLILSSNDIPIIIIARNPLPCPQKSAACIIISGNL